MDWGGMYGAVPKSVWRRLSPPDRKNRVVLGLNCLLVRSAGINILVDTGAGNKHSPRRRAIFNMEAGRLLSSLRLRGLGPEDIHTVVLTHLHFDHAGGCTAQSNSGAPTPTFPNANYLVQRKDWIEATNTNERTRSNYLPEDFMPLEQHGSLELVDGDVNIAPGVSLWHTGGHTAGHQMIVIRSEGHTAACLGDVLPTHNHLPVHYATAWDGYPIDTLAGKRRYLAQAEEEGWLLIFGHGLQHKAGYVRTEEGRQVLSTVRIN